MSDRRSISYTVYGQPESRHTLALMSIVVALGLEVEFVEQSPSLAFALAMRAGREEGPFLRTPEDFVLAENARVIDWLERVHPIPSLRPTTPVRRVCARILEHWIDGWLPLWPRRSWQSLEGLGEHLAASGFLMGEAPCAADRILAAWLEADVLRAPHAREHLGRRAPRLLSLGQDLLDFSARERVEAEALAEVPAAVPPRVPAQVTGETRTSPDAETAPGDDAIPISLLPVLREIAGDFFGYLRSNHSALKDRRERVAVDLGSGSRRFATSEEAERRRVVIGQELAAFASDARRDVRSVLEPVSIWNLLTLPPSLEELEASDPRWL